MPLALWMLLYTLVVPPPGHGPTPPSRLIKQLARRWIRLPNKEKLEKRGAGPGLMKWLLVKASIASSRAKCPRLTLEVAEAKDRRGRADADAGEADNYHRNRNPGRSLGDGISPNGVGDGTKSVEEKETSSSKSGAGSSSESLLKSERPRPSA